METDARLHISANLLLTLLIGNHPTNSRNEYVEGEFKLAMGFILEWMKLTLQIYFLIYLAVK
jgi:hypothetical protein